MYQNPKRSATGCGTEGRNEGDAPRSENVLVTMFTVELSHRAPVVISSRIDDGVITKDNLLCSNTVAANNLSPQKAAILLRLALTGDTSREYLENLFLEY